MTTTFITIISFCVHSIKFSRIRSPPRCKIDEEGERRDSRGEIERSLSFSLFLSFSNTKSHTQISTHSPRLSHTLPHTYIFSHTFFLSFTHFFVHTHTHSPSPFLFFTYTHKHTNIVLFSVSICGSRGCLGHSLKEYVGKILRCLLVILPLTLSTFIYLFKTFRESRSLWDRLHSLSFASLCPHIRLIQSKTLRCLLVRSNGLWSPEY